MTVPVRRVPWWIATPLGVAIAAFGAVLTVRPFTSLRVLALLVGIGCLVAGAATIGSDRRPGRRLPLVVGGAWIVFGVIVLGWPGITIRALATVVGLAMIVGGVLDAVAGLRGTTDERIAAVIGGAASAVFGVLALSWPDVTILVVAVVFGFRLVVSGVRLAWRGRDGHDTSRPVPSPGPLRRITHISVALVALAVALGLAGVSNRINEAEPVVDSFYDTPDDVPAEPGVLLRAEPFTRAIPAAAVAWRILYTTTRSDGVAAIASGIVVVPRAGGGRPVPVVAWAHGTTGVARKCAPSVLPDPWSAGAFFLLDDVIGEGWALVATDYVGLGGGDRHPYLVGEPAAHSVLDAVRAARQLPDASLSDQTVVWGHSQGGGAALWTGIVAPSYAPDVPLAGVAALAPASDLLGLIDGLGTITGGSIFASYALRGYADEYDDVRVGDYVRDVARTTFDQMAGRCLNAAVLASVLSAITVGMDIFDGDPNRGALHDRLAANVPNGPIEAPLLIAQGEADSLVLPTMQGAFVQARCAAGQPLDYRTYAGLDHVPLVEADSPLVPELVAWTHDRFDGVAPTPTC